VLHVNDGEHGTSTKYMYRVHVACSMYMSCTVGTFKNLKKKIILNEHKVYAMYVLHTHMFILHTLSIEYLLAHTLHVYTHVKLHVCM
jgi:hypothetical protein